jgi:hypothetical protein
MPGKISTGPFAYGSVGDEPPSESSCRRAAKAAVAVLAVYEEIEVERERMDEVSLVARLVDGSDGCGRAREAEEDAAEGRERESFFMFRKESGLSLGGASNRMKESTERSDVAEERDVTVESWGPRPTAMG